MTDQQVIDAIRAKHRKANISHPYFVTHYWDEAWVEGSSQGPYVKLPVDWLRTEGSVVTERVVIRVYAYKGLREKLAKAWIGNR